MTPEARRTHLVALGQALLVTLIWSSSWALIKIGLKDVPPLTFVGLRYGLAWLCLLPIVLTGPRRSAFFTLDRADWRRLALLGLVQIALTQGFQFLALTALPTTTASLILTFSPALVALLGGLFLGERMVALQWAGIGVFMAGAALYFGPQAVGQVSGYGLAMALLCLLANGGQALIGRRINRGSAIPASIVTVVSMGIGSALLLGAGVVLEGFPAIPPLGWMIIAWLAVVNTAFAFILWNMVQRVLTAMESSLINNTMIVPIAIIAVLFLGERLDLREVLGLVVALAGVLAVQLPKLIGRPAR